MSADKDAADRLAHALADAGIPLNSDTAAGMLAIGTSLLRLHGLSRDDVLTLASGFYAVTPTIVRRAQEADET